MAALASGNLQARPLPRIYEATFGTGGDVVRGIEITAVDAVAERKTGRDVVVCGPNLNDNRDLAKSIETAANGNCKACPPHVAMGPGALPHFQPDPRPPAGHCFYETTTRKSKMAKASKKL